MTEEGHWSPAEAAASLTSSADSLSSDLHFQATVVGEMVAQIYCFYCCGFVKTEWSVIRGHVLVEEPNRDRCSSKYTDYNFKVIGLI